MNISEFLTQVTDGIKQTSLAEYLAVFTGIASVWYSKKENILVYPTGIISTVIYIWLSLNGHLFGEASVNLYYTVMSIYGWLLWSKKDAGNQHVLQVANSTPAQWAQHIGFFLVFYAALFFSLTYIKHSFAPGAVPWADAFASATAYTGMWLMAKKKTESWIWWILTDVASVPLYYSKGFAFTSVYYFVLLLLAISGLTEWHRRARAYNSRIPTTP